MAEPLTVDQQAACDDYLTAARAYQQASAAYDEVWRSFCAAQDALSTAQEALNRAAGEFRESQADFLLECGVQFSAVLPVRPLPRGSADDGAQED